MYCVRIMLDENLPAKLVRVFAELGQDTDTIPKRTWRGNRMMRCGLRFRQQGGSSSRRI